jgi:hypothetical protein
MDRHITAPYTGRYTSATQWGAGAHTVSRKEGIAAESPSLLTRRTAIIAPACARPHPPTHTRRRLRGRAHAPEPNAIRARRAEPRPLLAVLYPARALGATPTAPRLCCSPLPPRPPRLAPGLSAFLTTNLPDSCRMVGSQRWCTYTGLRASSPMPPNDSVTSRGQAQAWRALPAASPGQQAAGVGCCRQARARDS